MRKAAMPESPELTESEQELHRSLVAIFEAATVGPVIAGVHSAAYCEDGETLMVMCNTPDGRTVVWSFSPGQPVTPVFVD